MEISLEAINRSMLWFEFNFKLPFAFPKLQFISKQYPSMNKLAILLSTLIAIAISRSYPLYKQCDPQWAKQQLGTSSTNTICSAGCLMSSAAMALKGTGHDFNPSILNKWLKANDGYASGDLFIWATINKLGLNFDRKVQNSQIKTNLDQGKVVICNVHGGKHWVLAHSYNGDSIMVNDPGYSITSYALSQIVDGQNGVYTVRQMETEILEQLKALRAEEEVAIQ